MVAIDTHAHVFPSDGPFAPGARYAPAYAADTAEWFALQESVGVTHGVLVQPSFYGTDNSVLLAALAAHPDRLRGVVVVKPGEDRGTLERWDAAGVRGIRLNLWGGASIPSLDSSDWQSLFEDIGALGWHVELHAEGDRLSEIFRRIGKARVPLVIDHFGRPGAAEGAIDRVLGALEERASAQPVFVKLSAPYRVDADVVTCARRLLASLGPSRLRWGSDWPWTNFEGRHDYIECRRWVDSWLPDDAQRAQILREVPASLFRFD